jgi:hypothetical protein
MTGTPTTSTFSFTTFAPGPSNYTVAQVATVIAKVQGWVFPTTWTPPAPPPPAFACQSYNLDGSPNAAPCTLTIDSTTTWTSGAYRYTNLRFDAVTTAALWQVTIDLSSTTNGFTGMTPVRWIGAYQNVVAAPGYSCTQLPTFIGREANSSWGSSNAEITFSNDPSYTGGAMICDV